jgi:hypothetical protein
MEPLLLESGTGSLASYANSISSCQRLPSSVAFPLSNRGAMSNMVEAATEGTPSQPAVPGPTAKQLLEAIKDNFVLVSAAALLIGVSLATTFLAAYLSVFDWHLLWFVQYTDIITFGLLALGIASGSITLLQSAAQTVLGGRTPEQRRSGLIILVVLWIAGTALNIWGAVHSGQGYFHILSAVVTFGAAVALIFVIASHVEARMLPTALQCMFMLLLLLTISASLGRWLGESVQETASFNQDVAIKDQTLTDAKLVMVMARHTVLLKDGVLYIVPTGDITKFRTADKNAKPK